MQSQVKTQKEKYEDKEWEKEWLHKSDANTSYLIDANWLDRMIHVPFHFVGKYPFVGWGILLGIIVSLITVIPFYILGLGFGIIGFIFSKFINFRSVYPPYFLSYKHAESYEMGDWWDNAEQSLLDAADNLSETYQTVKEQNPELVQRYEEKTFGTEEKSSSLDWRDGVHKVSDLYGKVDAFSALLEGDFGALGDLVGEKKEKEQPTQQVNYQPYTESTEQAGEIPKPRPLSLEERQHLYNESMKELSTMIGLTEVKSEVKNMILEIKANRMLEKQGITPDKTTMHMIFSGPPGTGKTVTARLLAQILQATGYLETGQLIEVNRSDLVAEYQGQTATKVKEKFEEARGGILFIDEAYALKNGDNDPFGQEAIDTIIPLMENYRKEMVVILAGYDAEMNKLMKANTGFKSRIAYKFRFTDYTPEQLTELTMLNIQKRGYTATEWKSFIHQSIKSKARNGVVDGNGRWVRNFVDKIEKQHKIMVANNDITDGRYIHETAIEKAIKQMN